MLHRRTELNSRRWCFFLSHRDFSSCMTGCMTRWVMKNYRGHYGVVRKFSVLYIWVKKLSASRDDFCKFIESTEFECILACKKSSYIYILKKLFKILGIKNLFFIESTWFYTKIVFFCEVKCMRLILPHVKQFYKPGIE